MPFSAKNFLLSPVYLLLSPPLLLLWFVFSTSSTPQSKRDGPHRISPPKNPKTPPKNSPKPPSRNFPCTVTVLLSKIINPAAPSES